MVWLAFAASAAIALYLWLRGHWFARVLAFLGLIPIGLTAVAALAYWVGIIEFPGAPAAAWALGACLAWLVSGIPLYVKNGRVKFMARRYPSARLHLSPGD